MIFYYNTRNSKRLNTTLSYCLNYHFAGIKLVILINFFFRQLTGAWNCPIKIICMGCPECRNINSSLCISNRIHRMCMCYAADFLKLSVKFKMRFCIRRWFPLAFYCLSRHKIDNHHILWAHAIIINSRGFNYNKPFTSVDSTNISPSIDHNASGN